MIRNASRWHRRKDELLRPDAFDPADIEDIKANTHNPDFEMLYQQDADGRALRPITEDCFPTFAMPPSRDLACVMSVDAGMTPWAKGIASVPFKSGAPSAATIISWINGVSNATLMSCGITSFAISVVTGQVLFLLKRAANGHALISVMPRKYRKRIHEITPKGSKTSRLRRHVDTILDHRILLPENAPWRDEFVAEFVEFPHGDFTDQVDATTQFLDWIPAHPSLERPPQPGLCAGVNSRGQPLTGAPPNAPFPKIVTTVRY